MREASEVMALASQVPSMTAFFALVGSAIQHGNSAPALVMLTICGLSGERAWSLIDGWDRMVEAESQTGWTPECVAMGYVMEDVEGWSIIVWGALIGKFQVKGDPSVADSE